jgi:hypothetical protein
MSPKSKPRDYKAEYARRIARGLERGLTRSQSAGKPKKTELPARLALSIPRNPREFQKATRGFDKTGKGFNTGILRLMLDSVDLAKDTGNPEIIKLFNKAMRDQFRKSKKGERPRAFDEFLQLRAELFSESGFEALPGTGSL